MRTIIIYVMHGQPPETWNSGQQRDWHVIWSVDWVTLTLCLDLPHTYFVLRFVIIHGNERLANQAKVTQMFWVIIEVVFVCYTSNLSTIGGRTHPGDETSTATLTLLVYIISFLFSYVTYIYSAHQSQTPVHPIWNSWWNIAGKRMLRYSGLLYCLDQAPYYY